MNADWLSGFIFGAAFGLIYPLLHVFISKLIQEVKSAKKEW